MAIELTVNRVLGILADELKISVPPPAASPITPLLHKIFTDILCDLTGPNPKKNWIAALDAAPPEWNDWRAAMRDFTYRQAFAPALEHYRTRLYPYTNETKVLWRALQNADRWLADRLWDARATKRLRELFTPPVGPILVVAPRSFETQLRQPRHESHVIRIHGALHGAWRFGRDAAWHLPEFVPGDQTPSELMPYRIVLIHSLIEAGAPDQAPGELSLLQFTPDLREFSISQQQAIDARNAIQTILFRVLKDDLKRLEDQTPPQWAPIEDDPKNTREEPGIPDVPPREWTR